MVLSPSPCPGRKPKPFSRITSCGPASSFSVALGFGAEYSYNELCLLALTLGLNNIRGSSDPSLVKYVEQ